MHLIQCRKYRLSRTFMSNSASVSRKAEHAYSNRWIWSMLPVFNGVRVAHLLLLSAPWKLIYPAGNSFPFLVCLPRTWLFWAIRRVFLEKHSFDNSLNLGSFDYSSMSVLFFLDYILFISSNILVFLPSIYLCVKQCRIRMWTKTSL